MNGAERESYTIYCKYRSFRMSANFSENARTEDPLTFNQRVASSILAGLTNDFNVQGLRANTPAVSGQAPGST
jgi:hypothetical protein